MDLNQLKSLADNIIKNGINIKDKDYLREIYSDNDFQSLINEFEELLGDCSNGSKQICTFSFFIGFFNLNSEIEVSVLPDFKELNFHGYLRGALLKYFRDEFKLKYNYFPISLHYNGYSFVANWWPRPFSIPSSLITLLNWIYLCDKPFFFKLFFEEKHNYLFLSLFKEQIIKNLEIEKEYVDLDCDIIKLYSLFNYLVNPIELDIQNLSEGELEKRNFNLSLIKEIDGIRLIKIILDYIRYDETKIIPTELLYLIVINLDIFYMEFEMMEIYNINELHKFCLIKNLPFFSKNKFFNLILGKLKYKFSRNYISVDMEDWKNFICCLETDEINNIKVLLCEMKNDLKYVYDLDKELRYEKYLIDIGKYEKFDELIEACDEKLEYSFR